jgi:hypothetical protein
MIAGVTPMPAMPIAPTHGAAATSAESGTISNPKSAIEGMVCSRFSIANTGPCNRGRLATAMPSGKPIATAPPTDVPASTICRNRASANASRWLSYSRAIDNASKVPAMPNSATVDTIAVTASNCAPEPAAIRWSASASASTAQPARTQNAMPKETREPDFAFATSALAACPAAASASSNNNAAEQAAAQCSALLDGIQQAQRPPPKAGRANLISNGSARY